MVTDRGGRTQEARVSNTGHAGGHLGGFLTDVHPREVPSQSKRWYVPFSCVPWRQARQVYPVRLDNWLAGQGMEGSGRVA
jgi:hypothetical protein